jgi:hypothetical protein
MGMTNRPFELAQDIRGVAVSDTDAFLAVDDCTAILRVRRSDLCASVIASPMDPIGATDVNRISLDIHQDRLIVSGRSGLLLEVETN